MSFSKQLPSNGMNHHPSNLLGTIGTGRPITRAKNGRFTVSKRLHVSNIPFSMTENDLVEIFQPFGPIIEAQIISNKRGSKGFGFVTFEKTEDALLAKANMNGALINSRVIEVNDALPKNKYTIVPKPGTTNDPRMVQIYKELNMRHTISLVPDRQPIRQSCTPHPPTQAISIGTLARQPKYGFGNSCGSVSPYSDENSGQDVNQLELRFNALMPGSFDLWGK